MVMIPYGSNRANVASMMWGLPSGQSQLTGREGELHEELRQAHATGRTKVFTAEDAQILGIDMSGDVDNWPDWQVKFTPDNSETGFAVSALSPDNYEYTQGGAIITPQGQRYSSAQQYLQSIQSYTPSTTRVSGSAPGYVQLDNGQWVSEFDYYSYQPEYRAKLKSLGVEGFSQYMGAAVQARADEINAGYQAAYQAEINANYVQLATGELVDRGEYQILTSAQQANLNSMGIAAFNRLQQTISDIVSGKQYEELRQITGSDTGAWQALREYIGTDLSPLKVHAYIQAATQQGLRIPEGVSEASAYQQIMGFEAAAKLERYDRLLEAYAGQPFKYTQSVDQLRAQLEYSLPIYEDMVQNNPSQFMQQMAQQGRNEFTDALVDYLLPSLSAEDKGWIVGEVPESGFSYDIPLTDESGNQTGVLPAQIRADKGVYVTLDDRGEVKLGDYDFTLGLFLPDLDALVEPREPDTRNFWQKVGGLANATIGAVISQGVSVLRGLGIAEEGATLPVPTVGGVGAVYLPEYPGQSIVRGAALEARETMSQLPEGLGWSALSSALSMLPLIAISAATGGTGAAMAGGAAAKVGLGSFGQSVLSVLGGVAAGGTTSRGLESLIESGAAYDEAIARGLSAEEAQRIANEVFGDNLKYLSLSDYAQFALAFGGGGLLKAITPAVVQNLAGKGIIQLVSKAGQYGTIALTEAGEEYYQEIIKRQAFNEDISGALSAIPGNLASDEELRQVAIVGAIVGVGMGGAVDVVQAGTTICEATIANLPQEQAQQFIATKAQAIRAGQDVGAATTAALDAVAATPEGAQVVQNVTQAVVMQGRLSEMRAQTPQEAQALVDAATATTKPVTGIEYQVQMEGTENVSTAKEPWQMTSHEYWKQGLKETVEHSKSVPAGSSMITQYFHVTPDSYVEGNPILSAREIIDKGATFTNKWEADFADYLSSVDAESVSLFDSMSQATEFNGSVLGGKGRIWKIDFPEGTRLSRNSEGYAIVSRVSPENISGEVSHRLTVKQAIAEGRPVPQEVLAEYPDLAGEAYPQRFTARGMMPGSEKLDLQRVGAIRRVGRPIPLTFRGTKGEVAPITTTTTTASPAPSGEATGGQGAPPQPPAIPSHEQQPPDGRMPKPMEARDSVLSVSRTMIEANGTNAITKAVARAPGIGHVVRFIKAKIDLDSQVHLAMVAQVRAQAYVQHTLFTGEVNTEKALISAFGKEAVYQGAEAKGVKYIGPDEAYCPGLKNTIKDICDNPERYQLTRQQQRAIDMVREHGDYGLDVVNQGFIKDRKNKIHRYPPKQNGAFLSTVDVGEDVIEHLGSDVRAVTTGRGKTRVYPSAQERWQHAQKTGQEFTPETRVAVLLRGQDAFKARAAGNEVYRHAVGGKTREQVLQETHPELYAKMQGLKKRLVRLQGYRNILTQEQSEAIATFLESDHESEDFDALEEGLAPALKPGRYVAKAQAGKDIRTLNREIITVKQDIAALRPAWTSANLKPYVMVKEGLFRYFDAKTAPQVEESLRVSTNFLIDMLDQTRRITFGLDGSPITVQGQIAALFDPISMVRITGRQFVQTVRHRSPFYPFSQEYIKDTIAAHPKEAAEFAMLEGIPLGNTFDEFTLGWAEKLPVVGKGIRVINDSLFTWLRATKFQMWMGNSSHLTKAGYDPMVAKVSAHAVMNGVFPMADRTLEGQSAARAKDLRALPTSYSFLMEPAKLMGEAVQGYAKIASRQTLTARERLSVEMMTRMAATIAFASVLSAALSGLAQGKDWEEIGRDMLDAINPDPDNGRFLSIIIGDFRVPLGGPYRALFRAIYPSEVEGVPFPVPFAGLYDFFKNRLNPFLGTQIDIIRNKDYSDRTILQGGWPAKFLQFLQYELEGNLPLSIGGVLEDIRTGKEYRILQDLIAGLMGVNAINMDDTYANRMWRRLGQPKEGGIYDVGDFWGDIKPFYGDADYNRQAPYVQSVMDGMGAFDQMQAYRSTTLFELKSEFEDAYEDGKITDAEYDLLQQYATLASQKERDDFRAEHPEMDVSPRDEWLTSHPHENALLALWGQAKIFSQAAYDEMMKMAQDLGISASAMKFGLPGIGGSVADAAPEMITGWFEYQKKYEQFYIKGEGAPPEAQLYRLQHPEFDAWMIEQGKPEVKDSIDALTIRTDASFKQWDAEFDALATTWEQDAYMVEHPDYTAMAYRLKALGKGYPAEWVDAYVDYSSATDLSGANKWQWMSQHKDYFAWAYQNDPTVRQWAGPSPGLDYMLLKVDYMALNTAEKQDAYMLAHADFAGQYWTYEAADKGCPMVAEYVGYQTLLARLGTGTAAEAKLYRLDHPDFNAWLEDTGKPPKIDESREELEISVRWWQQDTEYGRLQNADQKDAYLMEHQDYATAFFTREAMQKACPLADDYVAYQMLATRYGTTTDPEAKLYRLDHPEFDAWLIEHNGAKAVSDNRNALEIEVDYRAEFAQYDAMLNTGQRDAYLKSHVEFALAYYSRAAWNKGYAEEWVDDYADYYYHVNLMGENRKDYLAAHKDFFYYAQPIEGWADIEWSSGGGGSGGGSGGSSSGGGYTAESKDYAKYARQIGIAEKWVSAYVAYRKALDEGYSRKEYFFKHQDLYRYLLSMGIISEYEFTEGAAVTIAGVPLRVTKD